MTEVQGVSINWSAVVGWLLVAQWLFNIGVGAWVYFRNADSDNTRALKLVEEALNKFIRESGDANANQNTRLTRLETHIKHMPSDEEVRDLRETAAATKARVEAMGEQMQRIERQTNRIEDHLLRQV